jgi:hypothetical protein
VHFASCFERDGVCRKALQHESSKQLRLGHLDFTPSAQRSDSLKYGRRVGLLKIGCPASIQMPSSFGPRGFAPVTRKLIVALYCSISGVSAQETIQTICDIFSTDLLVCLDPKSCGLTYPQITTGLSTLRTSKRVPNIMLTLSTDSAPSRDVE